MAHELEIVNGQAQMFSGEGITPWHGLGTVIVGLATAEEALALAGLDWDVELRPQFFQTPIFGNGLDNPPTDYEFHRIPDRLSTVRSTDQKHLGSVSNNYHVYQNKDAFAFLNRLTDTGLGEAVFTTAGSLFGGSRTFMTLKLTSSFTVGDNDAHDLYLMASNSHDGSQAFTVAVTAIRAVCNNTVTMGLAQAKTKWSTKHKVPLEGRAAAAKQVLELGHNYEAAFEEEVQKMLQIPINRTKMFELADAVIPASPRQHNDSVEEVMNIWENEPTVEMGGGKGNAWGAFNALTFWTDHKNYVTAESRFKSIVGTGTNQGLAEQIRPKAHKLLMAMS